MVNSSQLFLFITPIELALNLNSNTETWNPKLNSKP